MISKDANFKMKGRDRSSREKDPTLGPGWAYMVANDDYLRHLVKYVNEDKVRMYQVLGVRTNTFTDQPLRVFCSSMVSK
jgi:hypothetical protein